MIISRRAVLVTSVSAAMTAKVARAAAPAIRIGVLRFGTIAWELDVIRRHGFDQADHIAIEAVEFATAQAAQVALQAGRVDIILVDWLWVAAQRAAGADWTFVPSSNVAGAVVAPIDSPVKSTRDLVGARLGIAGSPIDKSWLILKAYGKKKLKVDFDQLAKKSFGSPPLLAEELNAGHLDAALTFWPFVAKAKAAGLVSILTVEDAVQELGVSGPVPFVGFAFSSAWAAGSRTSVLAFFAAAKQAQQILGESDSEWDRLSPLTGAANAAELDELKKAYRRGIIRQSAAIERAAADQLYQILAENEVLPEVEPGSTIPPGTFW
jgi:NitT/TauT family transport system substrate-binding protein